MDDLDVLKFDDSAAVAVVLSWYLVKKMLTDVLYRKGYYKRRVAGKKRDCRESNEESSRMESEEIESKSLASIIHCIVP